MCIIVFILKITRTDLFVCYLVRIFACFGNKKSKFQKVLIRAWFVPSPHYCSCRFGTVCGHMNDVSVSLSSLAISRFGMIEIDSFFHAMFPPTRHIPRGGEGSCGNDGQQHR